MTQTASNPNYITVPDWERNERARHINYSPKVRAILTEAEYDINPEQTRRMLDAFLEEVEHDIIESPIDGEEAFLDRDGFMGRLKTFVEAANDPRVVEEIKGGDILSVIPSERGLRKAFEDLSLNNITGQRIIEAATERVKLYEIEQEANRRAAQQRGSVALASVDARVV